MFAIQGRPIRVRFAVASALALLLGACDASDSSSESDERSSEPSSTPTPQLPPSATVPSKEPDIAHTDAPQSHQDASHDHAANDAGTSTPSRPHDAGEQRLDAAGTEGIERDVLRPVSREPSAALIAGLRLPPGFSLRVWARDLQHARMLAVHEKHVYLTRPMQGDVLLLEDADGDGTAERRTTVATGLPQVHGIAVDAPYVYLATPTDVYRASLAPDGSLGTPAPIIRDLPAGGQHPYRTIAVGPDQKLYISVGSPCDACPIDDPEYATLLRAELDGSRREIYASGLRNTIGFGWHPTTGELWGFDHGSDWRGDDVPPEEINRITAGGNYGWPYCYGIRQIDRVIQMPPMTSKEAYCAMTTAPAWQSQAHEAPIGWVFSTASQFPPAYRNGAFVAFRGSWNRIPAVGYRIAYVAFENGAPAHIEDFVSGFLIEDGTAQFGRLAGVAIASDGSLLFSDDDHGVVYRVTYAAPAPAP